MFEVPVGTRAASPSTSCVVGQLPPSKESAEATERFEYLWVRPYSAPEAVVSDQGLLRFIGSAPRLPPPAARADRARGRPQGSVRQGLGGARMSHTHRIWRCCSPRPWMRATVACSVPASARSKGCSGGTTGCLPAFCAMAQSTASCWARRTATQCSDLAIYGLQLNEPYSDKATQRPSGERGPGAPELRLAGKMPGGGLEFCTGTTHACRKGLVRPGRDLGAVAVGERRIDRDEGLRAQGCHRRDAARHGRGMARERGGAGDGQGHARVAAGAEPV